MFAVSYNVVFVYEPYSCGLKGSYFTPFYKI